MTVVRGTVDRQTEVRPSRRRIDVGSTNDRWNTASGIAPPLIVPVNDREDRHGFDENRNYLAAVVGKFVPQSLARRAVDVSIETDAERYAPDESITITAAFANRLPVPITVRTPRRRLWGWSVDGELEASDETRYTRPEPGSFGFRPRERKRVEWVWDGLFERTDERRWVPAERREHEIRAFVALDGDTRPSATTTVRIE